MQPHGLNLKNNRLSERYLTQKCTYCIIPLIGKSTTGKLIYGGEKIKTVVVSGWQGVVFD